MWSRSGFYDSPNAGPTKQLFSLAKCRTDAKRVCLLIQFPSPNPFLDPHHVLLLPKSFSNLLIWALLPGPAMLQPVHNPAESLADRLQRRSKIARSAFLRCVYRFTGVEFSAQRQQVPDS